MKINMSSQMLRAIKMSPAGVMPPSIARATQSKGQKLVQAMNKARVPMSSEIAKRNPKSIFRDAGPTDAIKRRGGVIPTVRPTRKGSTKNLVYDPNVKGKPNKRFY